MDFAPIIEKKRQRFDELERTLGDANFFDDPSQARVTLREHARLKELLALADRLDTLEKTLAENQALVDDPELGELAQSEIAQIEEELPAAQKNLQIALLPPEIGDDRDAIVEIRAGTGGTEAAIFAADLYRMYTRFAELTGLTMTTLDSSPSDMEGFKQVVFQVSGDGVFRKLRYESGVHRVQRVPATEAQGRIHTSTATVAVMPEAEEVDIVIKPEDLRIEVCRAGGPGGQGVNTTDSAVQILHIPTGKIVRCQDGRSQQKNKERALQVLRTRLLEEKIREEQESYSAHRKSLIGSGGREEKIRTYNFPQNRVTDHRIGLTLYALDRFMEGEITEMVEALAADDMAQRLKEVGS